MSTTRATLVGGPSKLTRSGSTLFTAEDFTLNPRVTWRDKLTSVHGRVDATRDDQVMEVSIIPAGVWAYRTVLFPYLGTATAGTEKQRGHRIFGTPDVPLVINSFDGELFTLHSAAITKMPDIILGPQDNLFGSCTFTALVKDATEPEAANSFYTIAAAAYSDATFNPNAIIKQRYAAAWSGKTGFTAFQAKDRWVIQCEMAVQPITVQGYTREMAIESMKFMAKCIPVGPTSAEIDAALAMQGAGATEGSRLSLGAADLTITGTGVSVTLKNACLREAGYVFGGVALRNGELGWETTIGFATGVPVSQLILGT
jgi:hypothetical protein